MSNQKTPYPSEVADKFLLRLPDGMREQLKASAKSNNRTMNAEILARLEASYTGSIPSNIADSLSRLAEALELQKIMVLKERSLAYRLANSLKFLVETGLMPTHTDKSDKVKPLMELVDETVMNYKGSHEEAMEAIARQKQRLGALLKENESLS